MCGLRRDGINPRFKLTHYQILRYARSLLYLVGIETEKKSLGWVR